MSSAAMAITPKNRQRPAVSQPQRRCARENLSHSVISATGTANPAALMTERHTVAEGAHTAPVLHRIAIERDIDMPLVSAVVELLEGRVQIDELLQTMLSRPPGDEED